jgi:hypothetical protein
MSTTDISPSNNSRIAETIAFVDSVSLPGDEELPPGVGRDSDLERRLGELVTLAAPGGDFE